MSTEALVADEDVVEIGEVEELLVEEVSIDGLCGSTRPSRCVDG
jgi:mycofactocin precursor